MEGIHPEVKKLYIQETLGRRNYRFRYANPEEPQSFSMHFHDGYELLYIANGGGFCFVEGEKYEFASGDMIIINPNELHSIEMYAKSERWFISFLPSYLSEFIDAQYNPSLHLQFRKIGTQNCISAEIVKEFGLDIGMKNIKNLYFSKHPGKETLIKANLLVILDGIDQIIKKDTSKSSQRKLTEIISYINNHFTENITVESLANHFFCSKSQLSHMFSKSMGIPLKNYITHKRIIYAKELMATDKKLVDIAYEVGFNDYSAFCRAFKNTLHLTPFQYRKRMN